MDPEYITSADWREIGNLLTFLWLFLFFAIGFGFNFLMAHAIIPSLIITGHLPERFTRIRRFFYTSAVAALVGVGIVLGRAAVEAHLIEDFWKRWWICCL
ncbi:MAG: hypothetical protein HYX93_01745 [Chloroflexi bacterium]|nr:hypothetical protein [Chloroflexota bacterium]